VTGLDERDFTIARNFAQSLKDGWTCPECGDVMPAGYDEDDHFNCNRPEDFPTGGNR